MRGERVMPVRKARRDYPVDTGELIRGFTSDRQSLRVAWQIFQIRWASLKIHVDDQAFRKTSE